MVTYGVEIEYMIVDAESLNVRTLAPELLLEAGEARDEVERGALKWSNELASHLIELKTIGGLTSLDGLEDTFQQGVSQVNALLKPLKARLLPTAMHPWMDPLTETTLWPYGNREIYQAYDRIFDCRGHGWANLQSLHLNLGFANEAEFLRLHAASRLVLPLLPAIAASSPYVAGSFSGLMDTRLDFYRHNQRKIPVITGLIIPEPVSSIAEYHTKILKPMYRAIAPYDPEGLLQGEWLNSRGAIARFDRSTIEIRLLDTQECPAADLAVARLAAAVIEQLAVAADWRAYNALGSATLAASLDAAIRLAAEALITDPAYLGALGFDRQSMSAGEIWPALASRCCPASAWLAERGTLASRLVKRLGRHPSAEQLRLAYAELADCLTHGHPF